MLGIDKYYPNLSASGSDRWIANAYQSMQTIIESQPNHRDKVGALARQ